MFEDLISIAVAATGAGMVVLAVKRARSRGTGGALQLAAFGLLLIGAAAMGVVGFVAGIALSPLAWLGIVALALAGVLFVVGQRLEGRPSKHQPPATSRAPTGEVAARTSDGEEDFADIEAILKKHGIT